MLGYIERGDQVRTSVDSEDVYQAHAQADSCRASNCGTSALFHGIWEQEATSQLVREGSQDTECTDVHYLVDVGGCGGL